ncbi:hypothetical protein BDV37DRAFT_266931 [Aspergillus pseudonomiae]|uniref:Uncharacterized protein n=1 Tax=Aspergillus pseudonomiae TaxID=1506151 RepID=A0A5N7CRX7_9EURO|nr:uncharacterized protein BDV37DRAFT_266931 [Aspergillus pseudonomiae]KAE8396990.1 hypothetical protein BDV37DRAFT_266931 [Aspergillus pseudonomiae]
MVHLIKDLWVTFITFSPSLHTILYTLSPVLLLLPSEYPKRAASTDPQWLQGVAAPASHPSAWMLNLFFFFCAL